MNRRWVWIVALVVGSLLAAGLNTAGAAGGGIFYESRPDEVALYLSDIAFVRDTVTLPTGQDTRVLLPSGTYPNTLILTENGARVRNYRITPQGTGAYAGGGSGYILAWESAAPEAQGATREVKLEYLMSGASWTPTYDMLIVDDETVTLAFLAEIRNAGLNLDDTTVYLVAGRVDLSQQVDTVSQVTFNQMAVGYSNETVALPALGVGSVNLQHVYGIGAVSAAPGDIVYVNLVDATLSARRVLAWNAPAEQEVDVIYKVLNTTEIPFAEGIVRVYKDNLFMGSDFIEITPVNSEGSVTVGSLPDVRVNRSASQEYVGSTLNDYYQHTVTLDIHNFSDQDLALIILDRWLEQAWQFEFSLAPERQGDNLLRWEVTVAAGESLTITYSFRTEY